MRFLVFGTGGVGGYFGAKLAQAGEEVSFLARGIHLAAMKINGLRVTSTGGNFSVPSGSIVGAAAEAGPVDVVLFCVKSYDTEVAAGQLAPALHKNSVVLSLQNGIDNEEKIERIIPHGIVYGGVAYISARITGPGEITETGGLQRIVFGPLNSPIDERAQEIHRTFDNAGIKCDLRDDVMKELWRKFIFIASMGSFTALSRLTQGEIMSNEGTMTLVFDAMREIEALARKQGIDIEPLNEAKVLEGLKRFDAATRSSMYYDIINEKPMEIEALNGTVVRLGNELGVPTPLHRVIYAALLPYHLKHLQQRAMRAS